MLFLLIIWLYPLLFSLGVNCDIFTAQVELEPLLETQFYLVEAYQNYLAQETQRLQEIKRRLQIYVERSAKPNDEVLYNPINSFLLIKGLTSDVSNMIELAYQSKINEEQLDFKLGAIVNHFKLPTEKDLAGAVTAIGRLQDFYLLQPKDIRRGYLLDIYGSLTLTVDDLFELGRQNYNEGHFENAVLWLNEALHYFEERGQMRHNHSAVSVSIAEVFKYLTEAKLQVPKYSEKAVENEKYSMTKYKALCRGQGNKMQLVAKCQYVTNGNAYLFLGPVKQEQIYINPNIYVFHDVISDREIEAIKQLARIKLKTAAVFDSKKGKEVTAKHRISKSAWLKENDYDNLIVRKINKRISLISGLEVDKAGEDLQVANYGLGGFYEPHYDFGRGSEIKYFNELGMGNRIATWMFYMSDVEAGGATVFPTLNLTLWPKKGSAAFWYNLREDGSGDLDTWHGACPVLMGTKWVSNKWIHEREQEFIRPCNLSPNNN